ncbi:Spo0E family sporulation regulatory protein-aspartic acid phosphatase [Tissierella sp. Yu-01]|uniref:Spo0E family sporulation regulatory protein-aspartic acid phosphatase n=1 Tax=Tissierella sp. Yu-01 TaxID=3035694 RepID=UPI00240D06BB|nr:Spo0E family sporulation regulatory protein-aspartic acid phosphatase [Tissierella sp. Yu-01]WFA09195.1 Spo0E family sporulation regulatory protein-aspartic acid phosphatase [Tissierella sp. Yu-01]
MLHKLESLREDINKMIGLDNRDKNELIKKSWELDKYIVQAMKESYCVVINIRDNKRYDKKDIRIIFQ